MDLDGRMELREAAQLQIDEVMDFFDFGDVVEVLKVLKERGRLFPEHWFDEAFGFQDGIIRQDARKLMWQTFHKVQKQEGRLVQIIDFSSYLSCECVLSRHPERWVKISLNFSLSHTQDGTDYEG